jgi:ribosomal protein L37AE/L43A
MTDFMDGYREELPAKKWYKGKPVTEREVICCPECSSVAVGPHDNGRSEIMVRWQCRDCGAGFKRPAGTAMRVYINAQDR